MNKEESIKRFYEGIAAASGAPSVTVPFLIELTKYMDNDTYIITLDPEIRKKISDHLHIGLPRFSQLLQLLEEYDLIMQDAENKQKYALIGWVIPYNIITEKAVRLELTLDDNQLHICTNLS